jgi:hypothetical protein
MTNTMPTRTVARLSSAALMMLACVLGAPAVARGQTAEEIVAANIAASGGEQAIARIDNFTSKGRITVESSFFGTLEGTIEAVRVPGRGYYEHVVLGPIEQTKGWDGARGWELGPNGLRTLEGFEIDLMKVQSFVNPFIAQRTLAPAGLRIERLDDAQVDGRPQYVLVAKTSDGPSATMFIDRETTLLTRITMTVSIPNAGEVSIVTDVGGYKPVAGVMMSTTMTQVAEGIATTNLTFDDTSVNTAVDAKIFAAR